MDLTEKQYDVVVGSCETIYHKKNAQYGESWRVYRPSSILDKIENKAKRIRTLESGSENKVGDSIESELQSIVNYGVMYLIIESELHDSVDSIPEYAPCIEVTKKLMLQKTHDYGDAWREMRLTAMTDEILVKLARIKEMEAQGRPIYPSFIMDIINYAIFYLIRLTL